MGYLLTYSVNDGLLTRGKDTRKYQKSFPKASEGVSTIGYAV